ncbi:site-specific integrase [Chroococcus sp. FPU101]|uniref:tyrosine-type recombinase/integrase n=1 Tax=Chroococcus sp. FPU101 TaxID=1974212 RepID=UPI001AA2E914|nr:site-specific integrase [Chroococcus sp. FPU101]GFE72266.1 hypothetical protein CFPU101_48760 [Chroococcus sp. FPU101]
MIEIDWKKDYRGEFICPSCSKPGIGLAGKQREKRQFICRFGCGKTLSSIDLKKRSCYLETRLKDQKTDWNKDYHGEFCCPNCQCQGIVPQGIYKNKRIFRCSFCRHVSRESCDINIQAVADPINAGIIWYTNHLIEDFVCPQCEAHSIYFCHLNKNNKKSFKCKNCTWILYNDSIDLISKNISYHTCLTSPINSFNYDEDKWDLRAINPKYDLTDLRRAIIKFLPFRLEWFKQKVKKYIQYLCEINSSFATIEKRLLILKTFSSYLETKGITEFSQINRSIILDYLATEKTINRHKIGGLRDFFAIGTMKDWFEINQDIIRNEDYPKAYMRNPDPLSDVVREQIEANLHQLPDPIARMWIICFFAAMRPSELPLLKKDCLVQDGPLWKLIWHRKKTDDYHEIPITRIIAKVVQEQLDYINALWGQDWEYLFCHYHGLSTIDSSQSKLEPVKKVIYNDSNPLTIAIRCLIKSENILDENGKLAVFQLKLLRPTRLTQLFEQGHDLTVVSAWAGHKNFATTSTYYTEVSCELIERETGHIHKALVNRDGKPLLYESLPKSFWENPVAHKLELEGTHINTPIYGYCGLSLNENCEKFRACYTCPCFVAVPEKLPQYIKTRDELRGKQTKALTMGQDVLVEQFGRQADQLDKIIASLQEAA